MAITNIEWTAYLNALGVMVRGYTFNAWLGCDKVSPACVRCYIVRTPTFRFRKLRHGDPRVRTAASTWELPLAWNRMAARRKVRPRVFTNSLADWLDEKVPIEWLVSLLELIYRTPNLDWLLLTKRPQNWQARLDEAIEWHGKRIVSRGLSSEHDVWFRQWMIDWRRFNEGPAHPLVKPPDNVWVGITVEDQPRAEARIPQVLAIPARLRFLSCEPLLGPLNLGLWLAEDAPTGYRILSRYYGAEGFDPTGSQPERRYRLKGNPGIGWVIAGGESGDKKDLGVRPSHPFWFRDLRDQCVVARIPFFFKQWGDWKPVCEGAEDWINRCYRSRRKARGHEDQGTLDEIYGRRCLVDTTVLHLDGSRHSPGADGAFLAGTEPMTMFRVGKKAAGRELFGREWNDMPARGSEVARC